MALVPGTNMPLGPGFGSINDIPSGGGLGAGAGAFPPAPQGIPGMISGGATGSFPQIGSSPQGSQGLGNMVGVQLGSPPPAPSQYQPFRVAPPAFPAAPASAPAAQPPAAAAPQTFGLQPSAFSTPSLLNPTGNEAFGLSTWGNLMSPQALQSVANQQFAPPGWPQGYRSNLFGLNFGGGYPQTGLGRSAGDAGAGSDF